MTSRLIQSGDICLSRGHCCPLFMFLSVNALNDVTDGVTDHVVVVITSELVNDVLVTSLMTFV